MGTYVVKMLQAKFMEEKDALEIIFITFDYGRHDLKLLREEVKSKWLTDMEISKEQLKIYSWLEYHQQGGKCSWLLEHFKLKA